MTLKVGIWFESRGVKEGSKIICCWSKRRECAERDKRSDPSLFLSKEKREVKGCHLFRQPEFFFFVFFVSIDLTLP